MPNEIKNVFLPNGQAASLQWQDGRFTAITPATAEPTLWAMPGFVDSHCHILPAGLDMMKLDLQTCTERQEVLDAVADWARQRGDLAWVQAVRYDQTKFADGEHLTRADLDKIESARPILLRHVNGHASVANSAALAAAKVSRDTPNPNGGEFVRDQDGEPNGVLLERAHEMVTSCAPKPTTEDMTEAILRAGQSMSQFGITTASDMMTGRWSLGQELEAYRAASEQGSAIRLRLCMQWAEVFGPRGMGVEAIREAEQSMNSEECAVLGVKIFADGAIGSATAAIYGKYLTSGEDGQLIYAPDRLKSMIVTAAASGWPVVVHAIGDRATDLVLDGFAATEDPSRHRLEHAMILSDAQIERIAKLGCTVTMQPEFLHWFQHSYRRHLGAEKTAMLKRVRSLLDAEVPMAFNSDRPIVQGNPWTGIRAAVERPGLDPSESITYAEAVQLYTSAGAKANNDSDSASLQEGAWADFQLYRSDPSSMQESPVQTWKAGEPAWQDPAQC